MTTKEFIRRSDYYSLLNDCPYFFDQLLTCYRAKLVSRNSKSVSTHYVSYLNIECFSASELRDCESLYFDTYTYKQFLIDMRYFKAFVSRLSDTQLVRLRVSNKVSNLLKFIDGDSK